MANVVFAGLIRDQEGMAEIDVIGRKILIIDFGPYEEDGDNSEMIDAIAHKQCHYTVFGE